MSSGHVGSSKKYAFWGVLLVGALIPAAAQAGPTGALPALPTLPGLVVQPPAPAAAQLASPPPAAAVLPAAPVQDTKKDSAQDSPAKFLTQSEALAVIPDLQIDVAPIGGNKMAVLSGMYPPACAGKFNVASTALNSSMKDSSGTEGFAIYDKGGFVSCIQKEGLDCSNTANTCNYLSQVGKTQGQNSPSINLPSSETVSVGYLNKVAGDPIRNIGWAAVPFGKNLLISRSAADIAAAKQAKEAKEQAAYDAKLQAAILSCAQSADGIDDARESLAASGLPESTIEEIQEKIDADQKKIDQKDLTALQQKVKTAISQNKTDQFGGLTDKIFDYASDHPKSGDQLATMIWSIAQARLNNDSASDEDIDATEKMLSRALDDEDGLKMSAKNKQTLQNGLDVGIPEARLQVSFGDFEALNDKKPLMQMTPMGPMMNPTTMKALQNYEKLAEKQEKDIQAKLKDMGCTDRFGGPSSKRDTDKDLDKSCSQLEDEEQQISQIPSEMEQMHAQDQQKAQQVAAAAQQASMASMYSPQQAGYGAARSPYAASPYGVQMPGQIPGMMPQMGGYQAGMGAVSWGPQQGMSAYPSAIPGMSGIPTTGYPTMMGSPYYSGYYMQQPSYMAL